MMGTLFRMNTVGFLWTINQLERRFAELTSASTMERAIESGKDWDPLDRRLYDLSHRLFGNTGWTRNLTSAAASFDSELIDQCRVFLQGSASVVRRQGLPSWLYDLMNDASIAALGDEPSRRMPRCIRLLTAQELIHRRSVTGRRKYGTKKQRREDVWEYLHETYRLSAYIMLVWGESEPRSASIARMLLMDPPVGMGMLRDDAQVAHSAMPDHRYREVLNYRQRLSVQADVQDAMFRKGLKATKHFAEGLGEEPENTGFDMFKTADGRYLRDAEQLLAALGRLWDDRTCDYRTINRRAGNGERPDMPIWDNPMFLRDMAYSLMGPALSGDLWLGFEQRDRQRFESGVTTLRSMMTVVREVGLMILPGLELQMYFPHVPRTNSEDESGTEDGAGRTAGPADDERRGETTMDDQTVVGRTMVGRSVSGQKSINRLERERRTYARVGEDMAAIALTRFPDADLARKAAIILLDAELGKYAKLISEYLETTSLGAASPEPVR